MIEPLNDYVVIRPTATRETATVSGLIVPEMVDDKKEMLTGEVVAIEDSDKVEVGDMVLFNKFIATDIVVDNEKLLIIGQSKLIGIL